MKKFVVLPAWLSVLSLAIALFVPLGVSLSSDTSVDGGSRQGIAVHGGKSRFAPVEMLRGVTTVQSGDGYSSQEM